MEYHMQSLKDKILEILTANRIKHQLDDFPSGCSMIDFWVNEGLYVIQLEPEGIGFSTVNDDGIDLSTIPDEWHSDIDAFLEMITSLVHPTR